MGPGEPSSAQRAPTPIRSSKARGTLYQRTAAAISSCVAPFVGANLLHRAAIFISKPVAKMHNTAARLDEAQNTIVPTNAIERLVLSKMDFDFPDTSGIKTIESVPITEEEHRNLRVTKLLENTAAGQNVNVYAKDDPDCLNHQDFCRGLASAEVWCRWRRVTKNINC